MFCKECNRILDSNWCLPIYQHNPLCQVKVEWENNNEDSSLAAKIFHGKEWQVVKRTYKILKDGDIF